MQLRTKCRTICAAIAVSLASVAAAQITGTCNSQAAASASIGLPSKFNFGAAFTVNEPDAASLVSTNDQASVNNALNVIAGLTSPLFTQSIMGAGVPDPYSCDQPVSDQGSQWLSGSSPEPPNNETCNIPGTLQNGGYSGWVGPTLFERQAMTVVNTANPGIVVVNLIASPFWLKQESINPTYFEDYPIYTNSLYNAPPLPVPSGPESVYQNFAQLAVNTAQQVIANDLLTFTPTSSSPLNLYFTVWQELRGFDSNDNVWDYQDYTTMYNEVYNHLKNLQTTLHGEGGSNQYINIYVGGPYIPMSAFTTEFTNQTQPYSTTWGYTNPQMTAALAYWYANAAGADYVAIDGKTEIADSTSAVTDGVSAEQMYKDITHYIQETIMSCGAGQSTRPIFWMESHIAPSRSGAQYWDENQGEAGRVAALAYMAQAAVSSGLQWQPQEDYGGTAQWPDEGYWTSVVTAQLPHGPGSGGLATPLGTDISSVMTILRRTPLTLNTDDLGLSEPQGTMVVTDTNGTNPDVIALNINATTQTVTVQTGCTLSLTKGQVEISNVTALCGN
jgi:hypothetical protein